MPATPRKKKAAGGAPTVRVSAGAGMTAGLELWRTATGALVLVDVSPDGRFAQDVASWNAVVAT